MGYHHHVYPLKTELGSKKHAFAYTTTRDAILACVDDDDDGDGDGDDSDNNNSYIGCLYRKKSNMRAKPMKLGHNPQNHEHDKMNYCVQKNETI